MHGGRGLASSPLFTLKRWMVLTRVHDGYITNVLADSNTQLGAFTDVKTNSLLVVGKTAAGDNADNVYLRRVGGVVKIPVQPGEVLNLDRPTNLGQFYLGQWEITNKTANDGCGYLAIAFITIDTARGLLMLADFASILAEWPTVFTFGGSTFSGYLGEVSEESTLEVGGIVPDYDAELYCKSADFTTPLDVGDTITVSSSYDSLLVGNKYRIHTRGLSDGSIANYGLKSLNE